MPLLAAERRSLQLTAHTLMTSCKSRLSAVADAGTTARMRSADSPVTRKSICSKHSNACATLTRGFCQSSVPKNTRNDGNSRYDQYSYTPCQFGRVAHFVYQAGIYTHYHAQAQRKIKHVKHQDPVKACHSCDPDCTDQWPAITGSRSAPYNYAQVTILII